jgi:hypothetical protein
MLADDFLGSLDNITLAPGGLFDPIVGVPYQIFSGTGQSPTGLFENFVAGGSTPPGHRHRDRRPQWHLLRRLCREHSRYQQQSRPRQRHRPPRSARTRPHSPPGARRHQPAAAPPAQPCPQLAPVRPTRTRSAQSGQRRALRVHFGIWPQPRIFPSFAEANAALQIPPSSRGTRRQVPATHPTVPRINKKWGGQIQRPARPIDCPTKRDGLP